jgi:hypothetical protein
MLYALMLQQGVHALYMAAVAGHASIVSALIDAGSAVDVAAPVSAPLCVVWLYYDIL